MIELAARKPLVSPGILEGLDLSLPKHSRLESERTEIYRTNAPIKIVDTVEDLVQMKRDIYQHFRESGESRVAFDIETGDLRDRSGTKPSSRDLAAIGISVRGQIWVIDVLTLHDIPREGGQPPTEFEPKNLGPVYEILEDVSVEKLIHYAPFERKFFDRLGIEINNVYDTWERSKKLYTPHTYKEYGHDDYTWPTFLSFTLAAISKEILGKSMLKSGQSSNWMGPLEPEQIEYLGCDVNSLFELRDVIEEKRAELGRFWQEVTTRPARYKFRELLKIRSELLDSLRGDVGNQYGYLLAQSRDYWGLLKAIYATELADRNGPTRTFEFPTGTNTVIRGNLYELDVQAFRDEYPAISQKVLRRAPSIAACEEALESANEPAEKINEYINIAFRSPGWTKPRYHISADFAELYGWTRRVCEEPITEDQAVRIESKRYGIDIKVLRKILRLARKYRPELTFCTIESACYEILEKPLSGLVERRPDLKEKSSGQEDATIIGELKTHLESLQKNDSLQNNEGGFRAGIGPEQILGLVAEYRYAAIANLRERGISQKVLMLLKKEELIKESIKLSLTQAIMPHKRKADIQISPTEHVTLSRDRKGREFSEEGFEALPEEIREILAPVCDRSWTATQDEIEEAFAEAGIAHTEDRELLRKGIYKTRDERRKPYLMSSVNFGKLYGTEHEPEPDVIELTEKE